MSSRLQQKTGNKNACKRHLKLIALMTLLFSHTTLASPVLRCQFNQSDINRTVEFLPGTDPYAVKALDFNENFRFKAVVIGDAQRVEYIKLYTYYLKDKQAVLLHEAKYTGPVIQPATASPSALTGMQFIFSPQLGREFNYGCTLLEAAP